MEYTLSSVIEYFEYFVGGGQGRDPRCLGHLFQKNIELGSEEVRWKDRNAKTAVRWSDEILILERQQLAMLEGTENYNRNNE